jgi:NitT/TauT family transport system substrate-binding protein
MMDSPDIAYTIVPQNTIKYAPFMHKIGSLKNKPDTFRDDYFPEVHGTEGS